MLIFISGMGSNWAAGTDEIRAPFGFSWGESMGKIETILLATKARIVDREKLRDGERLQVEGIAQPNLVAAFFVFRSGGLSEVELQYADSLWSKEQYSAYFDRMKRSLEERHGTSQLIARMRSMQNEILHTLVGYQWIKQNTSLQIFLFQAEKGTESFRRLSLHYRCH
ncbi:MAG: hypothetical protein N2035_01425 [Chthoniobacterales bacterium]|nr:hypothetical protein [Chthoniobacterales bacterium]